MDLQLQLWRQAAAQGEAQAQYSLGLCCRYALWGEEQDLRKAAEFYQQAADQGDPQARYALGDLYCKGEGVPQDFSKAAVLWQQAADQGYAQAQYNLGALYDNGEGVERDWRKAAELYQQAANQGYAKAQHNLGLLYYLGNVVEQDYSKAAGLWQQASYQGHVNPALLQYRLKMLGYQDTDVEQDYSEALLAKSIIQDAHPELGVDCRLPLLHLDAVAVEHLLPWFTAAELNQLGTACKTLVRICRDRMVWRRLLGRKWGLSVRLDWTGDVREMYRKLRRTLGPCDRPLVSPTCLEPVTRVCTLPSDVMLLLELQLPTGTMLRLTSNFDTSSGSMQRVRRVEHPCGGTDDNIHDHNAVNAHPYWGVVFSHPDVHHAFDETGAWGYGTSTLFLVRKFDGKVVTVPLQGHEWGAYEGEFWPSPGEAQLQRLAALRDGLASTELSVEITQIWKDGELDEQNMRNNIAADKVALFIRLWKWTRLRQDHKTGVCCGGIGTMGSVEDWIRRELGHQPEDVVLHPVDLDYQYPDIADIPRDTLSGLAWK